LNRRLTNDFHKLLLILATENTIVIGSDGAETDDRPGILKLVLFKLFEHSMVNISNHRSILL